MEESDVPLRQVKVDERGERGSAWGGMGDSARERVKEREERESGLMESRLQRGWVR